MVIDKQHILDELRRITKVNGGRPPDQNEFKKQTACAKKRIHDFFHANAFRQKFGGKSTIAEAITRLSTVTNRFAVVQHGNGSSSEPAYLPAPFPHIIDAEGQHRLLAG